MRRMLCVKLKYRLCSNEFNNTHRLRGAAWIPACAGMTYYGTGLLNIREAQPCGGEDDGDAVGGHAHAALVQLA